MSSANTEEDTETERIAADLAYDRMKSDGTLHRMESERALAEQVKWEVA